MTTSIWSTEFWKATAERMVRGGAAATISSFVVGDKVLDAFTINLGEAGGLFIGGAAVSLLLSLIGNGVTGNGPALTNNEVVDPPA